VLESGSKEYEAVLQRIQQKFQNFSYSTQVDYYVRWNDTVVTNCAMKSEEEWKQESYFSYFTKDSLGQTEWASTYERHSYFTEVSRVFDKTSTITVACSIKEKAVLEAKEIWERQEKAVFDTVSRVFLFGMTALLFFVYLGCVCGTDKRGEFQKSPIDSVWIEVVLTAVAGAGIGAVALGVFFLEESVLGRFSRPLTELILASASGVFALILLVSLLSLIRRMKTRRFFESSILFCTFRTVLSFAGRIAVWTWKRGSAFFGLFFKFLSRKTGVILVGMLFVYTALIGLMGIGTVFSPIWLFLAIVLFGFACFVLAWRVKDLDEIKQGVLEIRQGNVSHQISALKCEDLRTLSENINGLAKGLEEAVSARVKAERLKSELITNVSHDLKTPITSIISYAQLLSNVEDLPEEARDYLSVIQKKSDRLKRLTQDLFDISKVQSGNESVCPEKLDISLLIHQALGEYDDEIQNSNLTFCVEAPRDLYVFADGRKLSRVFCNLIQNILKYAMKQTRVFIIASEEEGTVTIEWKNVSAYPLKFDAAEITQRFIRGDESRSAEGNGLGLAIAKSYTELCRGTFEIVTDGDLFKAILKFEAYVGDCPHRKPL